LKGRREEKENSGKVKQGSKVGAWLPVAENRFGDLSQKNGWGSRGEGLVGSTERQVHSLDEKEIQKKRKEERGEKGLFHKIKSEKKGGGKT